MNQHAKMYCVKRNSNKQQQQNNNESQWTGVMCVRKNTLTTHNTHVYCKRKMEIEHNWFEGRWWKESCHKTILILYYIVHNIMLFYFM